MTADDHDIAFLQPGPDLDTLVVFKAECDLHEPVD